MGNCLRKAATVLLYAIVVVIASALALAATIEFSKFIQHQNAARILENK